MKSFEDVSVRVLPTANRSGARNMALDAVAAERAEMDGIATVRVYGWEPSTLSLGYAQDSGTIDWEFCKENGIHITRRPTGGGAIYHDGVGDISYSIVVPSDILPSDLMESYRQLCTPVLDAFDRMGVDVAFAESERDGVHQPACYLRDLHPSHDLVIPGETPARKISGNAQYRRRSAIVQHGSLTFRLEPERHLGCFADDELEEATFRDRVTAIREHVDIARSEAITILEDTLCRWAGADDGEWTDSEIERATELVNRKFGAQSWIEHRIDPFAEA